MSAPNEIQRVIDIAHKHGWDGVNNSKNLFVFLDTALEEAAAPERANEIRDILNDYYKSVVKLHESLQAATECAAQLAEILSNID